MVANFSSGISVFQKEAKSGHAPLRQGTRAPSREIMRPGLARVIFLHLELSASDYYNRRLQPKKRKPIALGRGDSF